ncbi:MAG TPA: dephospho-CoA kinase [Candidatus Eisenbacteria bacterium]|nr:dephospho-CoA kinase [Candidatus Eisenbacteria bacterium]
MLRIGVTGRMASGKSTVARRFEARGAVRVDGDALGWETLRDAEVKSAIAAAFGAELLNDAGDVNRGRLGAIVFRDPEAMSRLNAIVQPRLLARVRAALEAATGSVVVLDAALVSTWALESELDGVVEVSAPPEDRTRRLRGARGGSEAAARERIEGQSLPPLGPTRAYWRIENDGDLAELARRADSVWEEIVKLDSKSP